MSKRVWEVSWTAAGHCKECNKNQGIWKRGDWHIKGTYSSDKVAESRALEMLEAVHRKAGSRDYPAVNLPNVTAPMICRHFKTEYPDSKTVISTFTGDNGDKFALMVRERESS